MKSIIIVMLGFLGLQSVSLAGGTFKPISKKQAEQLIKPFYDLFSTDKKASVSDARKTFHKDWKSYYSETGFRDLDATMGFVGGPLQKMLPDMKWKPLSISVTKNNEIFVKGVLSATPAGDDFFGVKPSGRSFSILTLDQHYVKDGKIIKSYHVEDWFNAVQQVRK